MRRCWLLLGLVTTTLAAADLPDVGFPGLTAHRFESICGGSPSVHFDPKLALAHNEFEAIEDHPAGGYRTVLVGRIDRNDADKYVIRYDDGPSCDPTFSLWKEGAGEPIGEFGGDHLVVPGNGFLYVIRRSNRSFEGREKWAIRDGALVEIAQPLYSVEVATTTRKAIELRQQTRPDSELIANVPKGESVTVVAEQSIDGSDWYLVRTRFGLLGWTQDGGYGDERQFEAIEFMGD